MTDNHIAITLPAGDRWLQFVHDSLSRYGRIFGFSKRLEEMFSFSVMEACEELFRKAKQLNIPDRVVLHLNFKGEAVVVDIEYSARIPLNPLQTEDYEVPDLAANLDDSDLSGLWLHIIKQRLDRVHFMVRGSRHVLRMIKYRRDEGKERQAWVMTLKPELKKGLVIHLNDPQSDTPSSVIQNLKGGVLKLGPSETFAIQHLDGQTSFHDIYMMHIDAMGLISPDLLAELYEKLEKLEMLLDPEEELRKMRFRQKIRNILNPNFSIPRADNFISAVHARVKYINTSVGLGMLLAIGLSGIIPLVNYFSRFTEIIAGLEEQFLGHPWIIAPFYALTLAHVTIHELGHGVTCKHYGGKVPRLGIMFYLGAFIFYCDTTAAWNFPKKWQRILVSLGGPIISFAVLGAGLWAAGLFAGSGSRWESVFVAFSLVNILGLAMNFNPFIKMDAYYMLLDYTGIPNLRDRSFRFLKRKALGWLGLGSADDTRVTKKESRVFWWYSLLGALMTFFFLMIPIVRLNYLLHSESIYSGRLFFAVVIGIFLIVRLGKMAFDMFKSTRYREYKIQ